MSYVDKTLRPGEAVTYRAHIHWMIYLGPILWIGLGVLLGTIPGEGPQLFGGIALVVGFATLLNAVIVTRTSEFAVTTRRVIAKIGFIRRTSLETLTEKVESIEVNQSILGRVLGYGTIIVRGVGGSTKPIKFISRPLDLRSHVYDRIEALTAAPA